LGETLSGARPGRTSDDQITVYKAMGIAMEDRVAANLVYRSAVSKGIGKSISL
jgi:alanine dehydrogenase